VNREESGGRPPLIERVREQRERHRERNRFYRIGFAVLGFLVLAGGLVMTVTPGPGIPVIVIGLAMLALEFAWAERWLEKLLIRAEHALDQVTKGSPARRAVVLSASVVGVLAVAAVFLLWDVPLLPG
jgi:uncharacterized protein (TIGR02611 family)